MLANMNESTLITNEMIMEEIKKIRKSIYDINEKIDRLSLLERKAGELEGNRFLSNKLLNWLEENKNKIIDDELIERSCSEIMYY